MARRSIVHRRSPGARKASRARQGRRLRWSWWPGAQRRRQWWRTFRRAPLAVQIVVGAGAAALLWLGVNWTYQVIRKPSELFFPVSGTLYKTPAETWRAYEPIFRQHATRVIAADLLAALAQVEGSGNPIVRTYWRWSLTHRPFEVYRPASSAVGMYQITDGTFLEARRLCIHDHVVVEDGAWNEPHSCWFNALYSRVVPSHAVELTAAYLDRRVAEILKRRRITRASLQQKQKLAAVIHLCGAGAGESYARRNFRLRAQQRCGDHSVQGYLARVGAMRDEFGRIARRSQGRAPVPASHTPATKNSEECRSVSR